MDSSINYYNRTAVFNSSEIRIAGMLGYEFDVDHSFENGSLRFTGGFNYEILKYMAESYNIKIIPNNGIMYAASDSNSNITDVGTMLMNDEVDVCISVHEMNAFRFSKFSFLHPHKMSKLIGYFIQPPPSSIRDLYQYVFKFDLWIALILIWILIILTLNGIRCVKSMILHKENDQAITDVLIWAVGAACQKGLYCNPGSASMKIASLSALLTGLLICSSYSAAIVSILARDIVPIKDLSDMISSRFTFYRPSHTISPRLAVFLKELEKNVPYIQNQQKIIKLNLPAAFRKSVTESKAVYISIGDEIVKEVREEYSIIFLCEKVSKIIFDPSPSTESMIVKKGSPWKELLNIKILWEMNNGVLHRLSIIRRERTSIKCLQEHRYQNESLGLNDVFSAVVILLTLYAFSLLCFAFEYILVLRIKQGTSIIAK